MSATSYPRLAQFLGAYFHQDWTAEAAGSDALVTRYLKTASAATIHAIAAEIGALRAKHAKEEDLAGLLTEWGCYYSPSPPHKTRAEWLSWLEEAFNRASASPKR
ncbi:MAG: hypothetical protein HYR88_15525 [Verrucomicrobia bacterium]|nr:hypothetical protein [Verrucomicrobiota bacterium]MBI3870390.1 hypothetical protein [Verrucomicrobiota bacterium]